MSKQFTRTFNVVDNVYVHLIYRRLKSSNEIHLKKVKRITKLVFRYVLNSKILTVSLDSHVQYIRMKCKLDTNLNISRYGNIKISIYLYDVYYVLKQ